MIWYLTPTGLAALGPTTASKQPERSGNLKYTKQGNPELRQLTGREDAFTELGDLTALYEGLATHVRQHVNPLSAQLQIPTPAPCWTELFQDPALPLQVDVGCGSGRFVLIRAHRLAGSGKAGQKGAVSAEANVLGLEIREKLVQRAQAWSDRLGLQNCRFMFTNATVSWRSLLQSYPGPIDLVSMQFPDPHFKKRHHKRRHVQPQLVREMGETMQPGARVFLQGDVPEAVRWMRDMFERHGSDYFSLAPECFKSSDRDEWETPSQDSCGRQGSDEGEEQQEELDLLGLEAREHGLRWSSDPTAGWLPGNPLGVPTEREVYVSKVHAPVYRLMLLRI